MEKKENRKKDRGMISMEILLIGVVLISAATTVGVLLTPATENLGGSIGDMLDRKATIIDQQ